MKPRPRHRLRLVVDNSRPPSEQTWLDLHMEAIVARALQLLRDVRMDPAQKEAEVRGFLLNDED